MSHCSLSDAANPGPRLAPLPRLYEAAELEVTRDARGFRHPMHASAKMSLQARRHAAEWLTVVDPGLRGREARSKSADARRRAALWLCRKEEGACLLIRACTRGDSEVASRARRG